MASTLVSLLLVYFLQNRFREPLRHLITCFEKTAEGELYYMVEMNSDRELLRLTTAFNNMSKKLQSNKQSLLNYNNELESSNRMLSESREFLGTLIDSSPTGIISANPEGKIMVFNRKACELFGYENSEMIGKNINCLFNNSLEEIKQRQKDKMIDNSLEALCCRRDSTIFPAFVIMSPVIDKEGVITAYLYLIKDISSSKSFQDMMIRLDRYYTRGEMAGDIAHEINNFLAILSGNVELMPLFLKRGEMEKIDKKLDLMKQTIDKIATFTDGLMDVNEGRIRFEKADINQLVQTVLAFLKPQNKFDDIEIITELSNELPLVEIDIGQIQQLLVNIVYNASEALEIEQEKKNIWIKTALVKDQPAPFVKITVHDNGPGVMKDKENWLFEKRFTTKTRGHGIGLITCKKIGDVHNASLTYHTEKGACFVVEIPVNHIPSDSENQIRENNVPATSLA